MSKGIALALETIVILIIAVSVLSISMFFLYSNVGPAQDQTRLERERTLACGSYINTDPRCEGDTKTAVGRVPKISVALKNIRDTCAALHERKWGTYESCARIPSTTTNFQTQEMLSCIKICCATFCGS